MRRIFKMILVVAAVLAVLGAAALGDIGRHFPDDDGAFRGADSIELLARAVAIAHEAGWRVGNVDATVICERPPAVFFCARAAGAATSRAGAEPNRAPVSQGS